MEKLKTNRSSVVHCSERGCMKTAVSFNGDKPVCGRHFVLVLNDPGPQLPSV